ncbi:MAG TPA: tRNA (N(6)-L-threonylcarbamoyladenosine(37)-C(2))-methylthiotransferase [Candidatus Deferrimicrobium sp.]|nr:tRNA (N(6)-L-threonylcarbamoyladenosine(37)-C(2))-methylthiotransferase [Candidatus Deferrimicrobium sp.]
MHTNIFMESFGCSFNQASSEIMQGILVENNFQFVEKIEDSDIIILNTCIVKTNTEAKILSKIKKYTINFPKKGLLITGCMPEALSNKVLHINPHLSIIGPHFITDILNAVQNIMQHKQFIQIGKRKEEKLCLPRKFQNPLIAKIQIAQGCSNNCSYCITKQAMGPLHSYSMEKIVEEIKNDLNRGSKEVWITAQDTGCYGFDTNTSLPKLLDSILKIPSNFKTRIGMMNPRSFMDIQEELIPIFSHPNIYKFLHIPLQSGNDEILQKMNRQYTASEIEDLLSKWRKLFSFLSISIDIIVGFPSETEVQFEDTILAVKKIQPDIVNISKFGTRPKTPAAKMKPIPSKVIKKRSTVLSEICNKIALSQNRNYIRENAIQRVLSITPGKKGGIIARTDSYKPVLLEDICDLGRFYDVKLVGAARNYLMGVVVKD